MGAVVAFGAALAMASSAGGSPADLGTNLPCGEIITKSVTLTGDMFCNRPGYAALVIGASNITLDLGGHTIRGDWKGQAFGSGTAIGEDGNSFSDVTIKNGTIKGFTVGIGASLVYRWTLDHMEICGGPNRYTYLGDLIDYGPALWFDRSRPITIRDSAIYGAVREFESDIVYEGTRTGGSPSDPACAPPPPPCDAACYHGDPPPPPCDACPARPPVPPEQCPHCNIGVPAPPPTPVEMRRDANRWLLNHYASWGRAKKTRRLACSVTVCHAGWTSHGKRRHRTLLMQGYGVGRVTH